jgi:hypothetical protein
MRIAFVVAGLAATILVAGGVIVMTAGAETTPTPPASAPVRTVSVQGVANEPIDSAASAEAATTVYRQAMAAAITDGQAKAQFLAEKAGATLGQVHSIDEGGGDIQCPESEEYQGAQPDFGSTTGQVFGVENPPIAAGRATPTIHRAPATKPPAKHHRRHSAKKSAAEPPCTLSTQIALVYELS